MQTIALAFLLLLVAAAPVGADDRSCAEDLQCAAAQLRPALDEACLAQLRNELPENLPKARWVTAPGETKFPEMRFHKEDPGILILSSRAQWELYYEGDGWIPYFIVCSTDIASQSVREVLWGALR
ncbi:MAG: hypothetical protein ACPGOY_06885 [Rhodospirillaceae bacterium]